MLEPENAIRWINQGKRYHLQNEIPVLQYKMFRPSLSICSLDIERKPFLSLRRDYNTIEINKKKKKKKKKKNAK